MAKNGVQRGNIVTATAPTGGVVSGGGYIIGQMFMVALTTQAAGDEFEGATVGGWTLPKNPSDAPTQFANAYWDATNNRLTTTSTNNTKIGVFLQAAANGDNTAEVRLDGVSIS